MYNSLLSPLKRLQNWIDSEKKENGLTSIHFTLTASEQTLTRDHARDVLFMLEEFHGGRTVDVTHRPF